jgi:predicted nucleic acid-binding protein
MKRLKLYIDTSVLNFLLTADDIEKTEITMELFDLIDKKEYDVFISDVVIEEIDRAPEPKRTQLVGCEQIRLCTA